MKKILLASTILSMGTIGMASAQTVVVKTLDTTSGDCLVAQGENVALQDGTCVDYLTSKGAEPPAESSSPGAARTILTSEMPAP
jgi:hypothetical protein